MITCLLVIQECDGGIAIDQVPLQKDGTELERHIAGLMDIGLRLTQEAVVKAASTGEVIEGAGIEKMVAKGLKEIGALNVREVIKKAGYDLP